MPATRPLRDTGEQSQTRQHSVPWQNDVAPVVKLSALKLLMNSRMRVGLLISLISSSMNFLHHHLGLIRYLKVGCSIYLLGTNSPRALRKRVTAPTAAGQP